jgi:hypothetical protein
VLPKIDQVPSASVIETDIVHPFVILERVSSASAFGDPA